MASGLARTPQKIRFSRALFRAFRLGLTGLPKTTVAISFYVAASILFFVAAMVLYPAWLADNNLSVSEGNRNSFGVFVSIILALLHVPMTVASVRAVYFKHRQAPRVVTGTAEGKLLVLILLVLLVVIVASMAFQVASLIVYSFLMMLPLGVGFMSQFLYIYGIGGIFVCLYLPFFVSAPIQVDTILNEAIEKKGMVALKGNILAMFFIGTIVFIIAVSIPIGLLLIGFQLIEPGMNATEASGINWSGVLFLTLWSFVGASIYFSLSAGAMVSIFVEVGGRGPTDQPSIADDLPAPGSRAEEMRGNDDGMVSAELR